MARLKGSKNKDQICPNGHDKSLINGRTKQGQCRLCHYAQNGVYQEKHKQKQSEYIKQYYIDNKEQILTQHKEYRDNHKVEKLNYGREYKRTRIQEDINFKLADHLRNRLYYAIKNNQKVGSAVRDLGCTIDFLKQYIESKFLPGMTWDNWGRGSDKWHLDHIKPLASFDLTDSIQFKQAVHYTNLQPLWEIDNLQKGSKF